jgi:CHAD domain-containing protein
MTGKKILQRWQRRFVAALDQVEKALADCRLTGSVDAVHDLRVILRRARLMALLGRPLLPRRATKKFRAWARCVSDALGSVRDCDVAVEWLRKQKRVTAVSSALLNRRAERWGAARPRLALRNEPDLRSLTPDKIPGSGAKKLTRRFEQQLDTARCMLDKCAPRFRKLKPIELHELRREIRRWRYLREILLSRRRQKGDKGLKRLIAFQEALGEVQNLQVIIELLARFDRSPETRRLIEASRREQSAWIRREPRRLRSLIKSKLVTEKLADF